MANDDIDDGKYEDRAIEAYQDVIDWMWIDFKNPETGRKCLDERMSDEGQSELLAKIMLRVAHAREAFKPLTMTPADRKALWAKCAQEIESLFEGALHEEVEYRVNEILGR